MIQSAYGGELFNPAEFGPGAFDERHRLTLLGVFKAPLGMEISPTLIVASGRPYSIYRSLSPIGGGNLYCFKGTSACNVGVAGVDPTVAPGSERGVGLFVLNARVTKQFSFSESKKLNFFGEFFNITDHANFGSNYGTLFGTATFQQPVSYVSGSATAAGTVPNSFQVQLGARFSY